MDFSVATDMKQDLEGINLLLHNLDEVTDMEKFCSVRLKGCDNVMEENILTSKLHLAAVSSYLRELIEETPDYEDELLILLPDFSSTDMCVLRDLIHLGNGSRMNLDLLKLLKVEYCPVIEVKEILREETISKDENNKITGFKTANNLLDNIESMDFLLDINQTNVDFQQEIKRSKEPTEPKVPKKNYSCDQCKKVFKKADRLKAHIQLDHLKQSLKCESCPATFRNASNFQDHVVLHAKETVNCNFCNSEFSSAWDLKQHFKAMHRCSYNSSKGEKTFTCDFCGAGYGNKKSLHSHITIQHKNAGVKHQCDICDKQFDREITLKNHAKLHRAPEQKCPFCPKLFHTEYYLKGHILRNHTPWNELPYSCEECQKGFQDRSVWRGHLNMHSGVRSHKCRYCSRSYQNHSNRMMHEKKAHPHLYTKINKDLGAVRIKDRFIKREQSIKMECRLDANG